MAYMTNDLPIDLGMLRDWETAREERMNGFKQMYSRDTAQELIDMATQYHWVNPQITAALVLNGAGYLMPQVGIHAAEKMAEAGLDPAERYRANRAAKKFVQYVAKNGPV